MREESSQLSGAISPTLIVMLGGLLAYFTHEPSLKSQRPDSVRKTLVPPPPTIDGLNAVHSRLWDDPLAVAYEDCERKHTTRTPSSVVEAAFGSRHGAVKGNLSVKRVFDRIITAIFEQNKNARLLYIPLLVHGEPNDSDTELRKRTTYAVLSGLAACGYELSSPDRVSYVELTIDVFVPGTFTKKKAQRIVVPVKRFQRSHIASHSRNPNGPTDVFVLWINEEQLGQRPLNALYQVLKACFGNIDKNVAKDGKIDLRILGPVDSDTLLGMAAENMEATKHKLNHEWSFNDFRTYKNNDTATIYSQFSTVSTIACDKEVGKKLRIFSSKEGSNFGLTFVRTVGSDLQLVQSLSHELKLRDAWPLDLNDDKFAQYSFGAFPMRRIVLIAESDTSYGRGLARTFEVAYSKLLGDKKTPLLRVFKYLRGLDGKIPDEKSSESKSSAEKRSEKESEVDPLNLPNPESIPASGRSQFDYLRRLERQLVEFDKNCRDDGEEGIRAIGVVGTDVYDKLLVLRALRKHFPRAWFFTTDLDASLSLPSELQSTHNLIVASHFGLELSPGLQGSALPFRDVYQTATYYSTLLALDDQAAEDSFSASSGYVKPLVFEIGRSGPYQLTIPESIGSQRQPEGPRKKHWLDSYTHALAVLIVSICMCIGMTLLSGKVDAILRHWGRNLAWCVMISVIVVWFIISSIVGDHKNPDGEPFIVFEGISIWFPTLIRLMLVTMSVAFISIIASNMTEGARIRQHADTMAVFTPSNLSSKQGKKVREFLDRDSISFRLVGIIFAGAIVTMGCSYLFLTVTESPFLPFRGELSQIWGFRVLLLAVFSMLFLILLVVYRAESCRRLAEEIGGMDAEWRDKEMGNFKMNRDPTDTKDLGELLTIRVIAVTSDAIGRTIKYPFIVLFFLILSRHPIFDMTELSWPLIVLWTMVIAALTWVAHTFRRDAHEARGKVVDRLRASLSGSKGSTVVSAGRIRQLKQYIAEIEAEERGAFQPLMRDPFIHALAFGASGGMLLLQHLLPFG